MCKTCVQPWDNARKDSGLLTELSAALSPTLKGLWVTTGASAHKLYSVFNILCTTKIIKITEVVSNFYTLSTGLIIRSNKGIPILFLLNTSKEPRV